MSAAYPQNPHPTVWSHIYERGPQTPQAILEPYAEDIAQAMQIALEADNPVAGMYQEAALYGNILWAMRLKGHAPSEPYFRHCLTEMREVIRKQGGPAQFLEQRAQLVSKTNNSG